MNFTRFLFFVLVFSNISRCELEQKKITFEITIGKAIPVFCLAAICGACFAYLFLYCQEKRAEWKKQEIARFNDEKIKIVCDSINLAHLTENEDINKHYFDWIKRENKANSDCLKNHIMENKEFLKEFFTCWYSHRSHGGSLTYAPIDLQKIFVQLYFDWYRKHNLENPVKPILNEDVLRFFSIISTEDYAWEYRKYKGYTLDEFQAFLNDLKIADDEIISIFKVNFSSFFEYLALKKTYLFDSNKLKSTRPKNRHFAWNTFKILCKRSNSCGAWKNCVQEVLENFNWSRIFKQCDKFDYDIGYYILNILLSYCDSDFSEKVIETYQSAVTAKCMDEVCWKDFNSISDYGNQERKKERKNCYNQIEKLLEDPQEDDIKIYRFLSTFNYRGSDQKIKGETTDFLSDVISAMPRCFVTLIYTFPTFNYNHLPLIFSYSDHCYKETLPTFFGRYFFELFDYYDRMEWFFRKKSVLKHIAHFLSYKFPIDFTFTNASAIKGNVFYCIALSGDLTLFQAIEKKYARFDERGDETPDYFKEALNAEYEEKKDPHETNQLWNKFEPIEVKLSTPIDIAEQQNIELYDAMKKYRIMSPVN